MDIPFLTTPQMIEVDRAMIEDFHIELIQMMENAGRNLAHLARSRFLDGDPRGRQVTVLAGSGGNGGGALVCARRLHNWGAQVNVVLGIKSERMKPVPGHQLDIVKRMGIPVTTAQRAEDSNDTELVIDGLLGYSLQGSPRGDVAVLIRWANERSVPILSLDVPSGIDADSGRVETPSITAAATMTLALPKEGLRADPARARLGELYLADISVPSELYAAPSLGLEVGPLFAQEEVIRLPV